MRLILASSSPRRAELLSAAGFDFEVSPAEVDETLWEAEDPKAYALRVALDKAAATSAKYGEGRVVLAADTVVVAGDDVLGKPRDARDAERMLRRLSDGVHEVHTAVVLRAAGDETFEVVTTRVHFVRLTDAEIAWYVGSGEPDGKAGAYAIQGRAARFIDRIDGSWSNVVGLPIATVYRLLSGNGAR
jgi:septum formation protein